MRIYLIGYRGVGKSTISQKLSTVLNIQNFNIDKIIEKREKTCINDIVKNKGWEYFRNLESSILEELSEKEDCIIDCGGGIVEKKENRELLKNEKFVFFLYADIKTIKERLKDKNDRPSLTGKDFLSEIEEVYSKRIPLYREVAKFIINAENDLDKITFDIIERLTILK